MIDLLEPRTFLYSAGLDHGLLTVVGSDTADVIALTLSKGKLYVRVTQGGVAQTTKRFTQADVKSVLLYGDSGSDSIDLRELSIPVAVDAGKGNDTILGSQGNDTLKGSAGDDSIIGNNGDDVIDGGIGHDSMEGNQGRDAVDYSKRTANIRVGLGSQADDGEPGENDRVTTTFEIIRGGSGNDTLLITVNKSVTLVGNAGNDTLMGNGADDVFDGGAGIDVMIGNGGNDSFYAADGANDRIEGGTGTDHFLTRDKRERVYDVP